MPAFPNIGIGSIAALRAHILTPALTSMDVLGSVVVFSLAYVHVISECRLHTVWSFHPYLAGRFGPITITHITLILAVFCAAKYIAGIDLRQLLWTGLEKVTGLVGWLIRFIVYACFFIACLVVVPKIVAFVYII
ncbi:hypothetical protein ARMGADRAFT_1083159 [Armillaria gallica]|uniref:Uncharacterized protein n=1 Tax=Armillaria gallica TaxID=47427 RepID=A0A2H3DMK0_ARMGA|nr:hypothetical protein ARMGADRAFT_1083159 [Armillaria gallica]